MKAEKKLAMSCMAVAWQILWYHRTLESIVMLWPKFRESIRRDYSIKLDGTHARRCSHKANSLGTSHLMRV
eukprot:4856144-Amphidinium_carterae.1